MKLPKNKLKDKIFYFLVILFTFLLTASSNPAQAQADIPLTVAPARQELLVDPGEKTAITIKFYNRGDTPVSGLLKMANFIVKDDQGTPEFLEGPTQLAPRFAADSWVTLPYDRMTIASKDMVLIQAKINVPADARPGGRYLAIYFEPGGTLTGGEEKKEVAIASRLAGLVYLRVSGPIKEDAYVVQMMAPQFSEYGPVTVTTEILNRGDYHIRPKGTITVTNLFGQQVDEVKLTEQNIFPDVSRSFSNAAGAKWMVGKYKAELAATYGETGKALTAVIFFWVFPWKVATIIVLTIIVVVLLTNIIWRRLRKREEELEEKVEELEKKIEEKK
ncbi:MAG TPA: hypothetical protein VMX76_04060 [Nevskiaceae bacterium]|nr:hypothetical protein [Nevskiaceae bacterium]